MLKVSCHQLHAIQISNTFFQTISLKPGSQGTHNVHNQATRMTGSGGRDSQGLLGREGGAAESEFPSTACDYDIVQLSP
jgi:hypothetical protein